MPGELTAAAATNELGRLLEGWSRSLGYARKNVDTLRFSTFPAVGALFGEPLARVLADASEQIHEAVVDVDVEIKRFGLAEVTSLYVRLQRAETERDRANWKARDRHTTANALYRALHALAAQLMMPSATPLPSDVAELLAKAIDVLTHNDPDNEEVEPF
jgi:hypothetical protein